MVDILAAEGLPASVLHHRRGFRCTWFENDTPIVAAPDVRLSRNDLLVIPETYGASLGKLPRDPGVVLLNQNAYLTFTGTRGGRPSYSNVSHLVAVSQANSDYLRFAFPDIPVSVISPGVDSREFYPVDGLLPRRIAYMPRKRSGDADQIFAILGERLTGWEKVSIDGQSQRETADILRSCPIFLSLSQREGFGLPPAEAMASGCYVIGFTGIAGREFMRSDFSKPVEEDDMYALAVALAAAARRYEDDPAAIRELGRLSSNYILGTYAPERERERVTDFFAPLLTERQGQHLGN